MSVAARRDEKIGVRLGDGVCYLIRFEDCTAEKTVIKHMQNGILLKKLMTEVDVAGYAAMIIDESHDCTLSTDIFRGVGYGTSAA
ncbi:hypothetical protein O181_124309 [Austropuccinia psidii MF-1]|uniref:Uncharacterized protein n=1 Tax=Austropuccinia psidii MF-1 TaxID=1389203 RepID=A0A9Q3KP74_9BASI|nr:hypothetical protein [Austropuccinia psidii MF-1]